MGQPARDLLGHRQEGVNGPLHLLLTKAKLGAHCRECGWRSALWSGHGRRHRVYALLVFLYNHSIALFPRQDELLTELRRIGEAARDYLRELHLEIHPDKYRLGPTGAGLDFCGFVVFADGRIRIRSASVRRFGRRYRALRHAAESGEIDWATVTRSVGAWVAHASHAQSYGLRGAVLRV